MRWHPPSPVGRQESDPTMHTNGTGGLRSQYYDASRPAPRAQHDRPNDPGITATAANTDTKTVTIGQSMTDTS